MNILDIFYNEIIKEASEGKVEADMFYNLLFSTKIGENKTICVNKYEELLVPTLMIDNKEEFDRLLNEYTLLAYDFYDDYNYHIDNLDEKDYQKIKLKTIMALLFANATYEDFNNPCTFLKKRIDFFNNSKEENYDLGKSNLLKANLKLEIEKDVKIINVIYMQFKVLDIMVTLRKLIEDYIK